jgi:hypothetical protein
MVPKLSEVLLNVTLPVIVPSFQHPLVSGLLNVQFAPVVEKIHPLELPDHLLDDITNATGVNELNVTVPLTVPTGFLPYVLAVNVALPLIVLLLNESLLNVALPVIVLLLNEESLNVGLPLTIQAFRELPLNVASPVIMLLLNEESLNVTLPMIVSLLREVLLNVTLPAIVPLLREVLLNVQFAPVVEKIHPLELPDQLLDDITNATGVNELNVTVPLTVPTGFLPYVLAVNVALPLIVLLLNEESLNVGLPLTIQAFRELPLNVASPVIMLLLNEESLNVTLPMIVPLLREVLLNVTLPVIVLPLNEEPLNVALPVIVLPLYEPLLNVTLLVTMIGIDRVVDEPFIVRFATVGMLPVLVEILTEDITSSALVGNAAAGTVSPLFDAQFDNVCQLPPLKYRVAINYAPYNTVRFLIDDGLPLSTAAPVIITTLSIVLGKAVACVVQFWLLHQLDKLSQLVSVAAL